MTTPAQYRAALRRLGCRTSLGRASKMPCPTYSLPAKACRVGSALARVVGSVCEGCYAFGGNYRFHVVQKAMAERLLRLTSRTWVADMVTAIGYETSDYFRWHDSGDLQSPKHLRRIVDVARQLPHIKFWLPTREYDLVRRYVKRHDVPANLIIRISAPMVDGPAPLILTRRGAPLPVSFVHKDAEPRGQVCPAPTQGNKCRQCRACWDPTLSISYHHH